MVHCVKVFGFSTHELFRQQPFCLNLRVYGAADLVLLKIKNF